MALRKGTPWDLYFSPFLEQNYQHSQIDWYRDSIRISSLLGVLLLFASYLVEWFIQVQADTPGTVARGIAITNLLATYIYICKSKMLNWKYWFVTANALLVTATLLLLARGMEPPIKQFYYSNIFFVEIVVFAFVRLPMNFTSTLGLILLIMIGGALYQDNLDMQVAAYVLFFLTNGTIVAIMVALKTEKMSRESFLQSQLIYHEKNQLRELNDRLNEQMSLDRITHLLNRMAFEDKLLYNWSLACGNKESLIMIAVYIEHFTYFNENNGEEAGDDLLREVARKIRTSLPDSNDIAARISGGRFIILFANHIGKNHFFLEKLRCKLLKLTVPERYQACQRQACLSWGMVQVEPDSEHDPRGMIDRMFNHLAPIEQTELCSKGRIEKVDT